MEEKTKIPEAHAILHQKIQKRVRRPSNGAPFFRKCSSSLEAETNARDNLMAVEVDADFIVIVEQCVAIFERAIV